MTNTQGLKPNGIQQVLLTTQRVNYLPPYTHQENGWLYGVWYCGTPFQRTRIHGAYPANFVKRVLMIISREKLLHLCCGEWHIEGGVNVDLHPRHAVDVQADAEALPFANESFANVLIDPPYSEEDARRYGARRLLSYVAVMKETWRVLRPHGSLLWLDEMYPAYHRKRWALYGLIAVVTGFQRRTRVLAFLRKVV